MDIVGQPPPEIHNGPRIFGGLAFQQLYCEQGIAQIIIFIKHWQTKGPVQNLLYIAVSWFQKQCGTSFSIFENTTTILLHLEGLWICSL